MSPYLFTLVMEVLALMLKRGVIESPYFKYHPKCSKLGLLKLCFADELIMFSYGNKDSVMVLLNALNEFREISVLVPSIPKSTAFFANVGDVIWDSILQVLPFDDGKFPIKYLGVPLISTRLLHKDCKILMEKVKNRIGDWKTKSLSISRRILLVISMLSSMYVFWASVLILPKSITKEIEKLLVGFIWCQSNLKPGKAKVLWKDVCLPKSKGVLGFEI